MSDSSGIRPGFMIEFNFELIPNTESAYKATIDHIKCIVYESPQAFPDPWSTDTFTSSTPETIADPDGK